MMAGWFAGVEWYNADKAVWHRRAGVLTLTTLPSVLFLHVPWHRRVWRSPWPRLSPRLPHLCRCVDSQLLSIIVH